MVIQCTHCQSRFKLADDKLKPEGTKVRCSKCREVFTVFPGDTAPPPQAATVPTPTPVPATATEPEPAAPPPSAATAEAPSAAGFDFGDVGGEASAAASTSETMTSGGDEATGAIIDEFAFDVSDFGTSPVTTQPEEITPFQTTQTQAGFGEFDFTSAEPPTPPTSAAPASAEEQSAFGEISFGNAPAETPPAEEGPAFDEFTFDVPETGSDFTPAPVSSETFAFGEVSDDAFNFDEKPQPPPASFDFEEDAFATPGGGSGGKAAEPFNFDSLSFDDSAAATTVAIPGEPPTNPPYPAAAPSETVLPAPRPVPAERPERPAPPQRPASASRPMPAVPKPPRYRISPMGVLLRLVFVIFVGICGAAVYFYYQPGAIDIKQYIGDLIGKVATPVEKGRIRLDKLSGSYVRNQHVGDLFVIRGEAVNEFAGPRSAIEVRGALLAKDGKVLRERKAFCGNPLSDKTLRTASFATIEEAMNNQFGDLMSNLKIPAGSAIPFTIVFRNLPPEMTEYTVELVDAKPASN